MSRVIARLGEAICLTLMMRLLRRRLLAMTALSVGARRCPSACMNSIHVCCYITRINIHPYVLMGIFCSSATPAGHPHAHCLSCSMSPRWPSSLSYLLSFSLPCLPTGHPAQRDGNHAQRGHRHSHCYPSLLISQRLYWVELCCLLGWVIAEYDTCRHRNAHG